MPSTRITQNYREIIAAQSTITGKSEYLTSTNGFLNTNASVTISGSPIPVTGATTAIVTAIVDGSGNQITSFGGGTQYTDGGVPPTHPVGNTIEWSDGSNWQTVSTAKPLPVSATFSPSGTQDTNIKQVGGATFALGQQLAAASLPIVLTAAQITTLTPPAAITNYALETGGNLATLAGTVTSSVLQTNEKQINGVVPLMGNGVTGTGSQRVTIASDNTAFSVNATLSAETTKVIGTVNQGTSPWVVSLSSTTITGTVTVAGAKTNNNAAPGATNIGALIGIANAAAPTYTEGDQVLSSLDLSGNTRIAGAVTANAGTNLNTSALATSTNLTSGTQKTQIVDGSGNVIASTSNALNINISSGSIANTSFAATQATASSLNATVVGTGTFAVQATLSAETTKVIGTVNQGTSPWVVNDPGLPDTLGQKTSAGSTGVVVASDQTAIPVNLSPSTSGGWSAYALGNTTNAALTTTQTVSASAGKFAGYMTLINLNSAPAYIQVFDTTGAVTLGTTAPNFVIAIPANTTAANGVAANLELSNGLAIANGIKIAATTTSNGASTVATGVTGTILFK